MKFLNLPHNLGKPMAILSQSTDTLEKYLAYVCFIHHFFPSFTATFNPKWFLFPWRTIGVGGTFPPLQILFLCLEEATSLPGLWVLYAISAHQNSCNNQETWLVKGPPVTYSCVLHTLKLRYSNFHNCILRIWRVSKGRKFDAHLCPHIVSVTTTNNKIFSPC